MPLICYLLCALYRSKLHGGIVDICQLLPPISAQPPPCAPRAPLSRAALQLERRQSASLRQQLLLEQQQAEERQLAAEALLHTQHRQLLVASARCALHPRANRHMQPAFALHLDAHPTCGATRSIGSAAARPAGAAPGSARRRWPASSIATNATCGGWRGSGTGCGRRAPSWRACWPTPTWSAWQVGLVRGVQPRCWGLDCRLGCFTHLSLSACVIWGGFLRPALQLPRGGCPRSRRRCARATPASCSRRRRSCGGCARSTPRCRSGCRGRSGGTGLLSCAGGRCAWGSSSCMGLDCGCGGEGCNNAPKPGPCLAPTLSCRHRACVQAESGARAAADLRQQLAARERQLEAQSLAAAEAAAEAERLRQRLGRQEQELAGALADRADLQDAVDSLRRQVALLKGQLGRDRVLQSMQWPAPVCAPAADASCVHAP